MKKSLSRIILFSISIILFFGNFENSYSQNCINSLSTQNVYISSTQNGADVLFTSSHWCRDALNAYSNESWIYPWIDSYEDYIYIGVETNPGFERQGTVIIDDVDDIIINVTQEACASSPAPGEIHGDDYACFNSNKTYYIDPIPGIENYYWNVYGATIVSGNGTSSIVINISSGGGSTVEMNVSGSNQCGAGPATSKTVTKTFPPTITSHQSNQTVCNGVSASFSVGASGTGPLYYQWEVSTNGGGSWSNIGGATNSSYQPNTSASMNGYRYRCLVQNTCGNAYSNSALLTVKSRPTSNTTGSTTTCYGNNSSVSISLGGSPPWNFTYSDGSTSSNITNVYSNPYILTVPPTSTKTYSVTALSDNAGCSAISSDMTGSATITVNPLPSPPSVNTNQTFCGSATVANLTATPPSGSTVEWFNVSSGGSVLNSGTGLSTGTYFVQSRNSSTSCISSRIAVAVIINSLPSAPSVNTNQNFCGSATVANLTATPPSGSEVYWFTVPSGGNPIYGNTGISSGTYYVQSRNSTTSCTSSRTAVAVSINPIPQNPTVNTSQVFCGGNKTISDLNALAQPGCNAAWFDVNGYNIDLSTPLSSGNYYVRSINPNTSCQSERVEVSVQIKPVPQRPNPIAGSSNVCGDQVISSSSYMGGELYWFNDQNQMLGQGNSYTVRSSGRYCAKTYIEYDDCWSLGTDYIDVVIKPYPQNPGTPTVSNDYCGPKTLTRGTPPGNDTWYWQGTSDGTSTTLGSGQTFQATTSGTYYIKALSSGGCWSVSPTSVYVPINPLPSLPTANNNQVFCGSRTIAGLEATPPSGSIAEWYNVAGGGSVLTSGTALSSGVYYVQSRNSSTSCVSSSRTMVNVVINSLPSSPTVTTSQPFCGSATVGSLVATPPSGSITEWYNVADGGTILSGESSLATGTYYVQSKNSTTSCTSARTSVNVTINPNPSAPSVNTTQAFCGSGSVAGLVASPPSGSIAEWYNVVSGGSVLSGGATLNTGTYYVQSRNSSTSCASSSRTLVNVVINSLPSSPTVNTSQPFCGSAMVGSLVATPPSGSVAEWYNVADGGTILSGGSSLATGTYYVQSKNSTTSCTSARTSVNVTINPNPSAPSVNTSQAFCGSGSIASLVASPPSGSIVEWYNVTSGGSVLPDGTTLNTGTYYVQSRNSSTSCISSRTSVGVTIHANPTTPTVIQPYIIPYNTSGTLSSGGAGANESYRWYSVPTGGIALGSTTTPPLTATTNFYVSKYNSLSNCESTSRTTFTVTVNQSPVPNAGPDKTIELPANQVTLAGIATDDGTIQSYKWTQVSGPVVSIPDNTNATVTISNLSENEYVFRLTVTDNYNYSAYDDITVTVNPIGNVKYYKPTLGMNSVETITFDEKGAINGQSIAYYDELGRPIQSLSRSLATGKIMGLQTIYDGSGRPAISTLPVPVQQNSMEYVSNLVTNDSNEPYIYSNFEKSTPDEIFGKLAEYYSDANVDEPYAPSSKFPYTRTAYSSILGGVAVKAALAGESHKIGSGHESKTYNIPAPEAELIDFATSTTRGFGSLRNLSSETETDVNLEYKALTKSISIDADGKTSVTYSSGDKMVASCLADETKTPENIAAPIDPEFKYYDIHISSANSTVSVNNGVSFEVYDLGTDMQIGNSYTGSATLGKGVYRIVCSGEIPTGTKVTYPLHYTGYSFSIYDEAGGLVYSVSPKSYEEWVAETEKTITNFKAKFASYNRGNALIRDGISYGWITESSSPDEGVTTSIFRKDGKIRFSQNAQQKAEKKFSYTNYDYLGRACESGEYFIPEENEFDATTAINVLENQFSLEDPNADGLADAVCHDQIFTYYDIPELDILNDYSQHYTYGAITKSVNNNQTTWYSYTYDGKVEWLIKQLPDNIGKKTIQYDYDFTGNVTKVLYQKESYTENFTHLYKYDADNRLAEVLTQRGNEDPVLQAKYQYYLHGPLKRVELAGNLQGIDYVYTINGQLKSINHPGIGEKDPGLDGLPGIHYGFGKDVFGMSLNYYKDDYTRTGKDVGSVEGNNYYNGNIAYTNYANLKEDNTTKQFGAYQFTYDKHNWLESADFGSVSGTSFSPDLVSNLYREAITSYDANGNIQGLIRNAASAMDNLSYKYIPGTNKLEYLTDAVSSSGYATDITNQSAGNYKYNNIGQLTDNVKDDQYFTYDVYGHVTEIKKLDNSILATYTYDDAGFRVKKVANDITTWYVRDASGNILATYIKDNASAPRLDEYNLYGSSRIGIAQVDQAGVINTYVYELTDHLGNVRAAIKADGTDAGTDPDILSYTDYYPFGMEMPGRKFVSSEAYQFGYQGQFAEKNKVGSVEYSHFEARDYDSRIGRWLIPDPEGQYWSPYLGMGNNPVILIDRNGEWVWVAISAGVEVAGLFISGEVHFSDFSDPDKWKQATGKVLIAAAEGIVTGLIPGAKVFKQLTGASKIIINGVTQCAVDLEVAAVQQAIYGRQKKPLQNTGTNQLAGLTGNITDAIMKSIKYGKYTENLMDIALNFIFRDTIPKISSFIDNTGNMQHLENTPGGNILLQEVVVTPN